MAINVQLPHSPTPIQLVFDWHGARYTIVVMASELNIEHNTPRIAVSEGAWCEFRSFERAQPSRVRMTIGGEVISQNVEASLEPPRPIGMRAPPPKPKRKARAKPKRKARRRRR